MSNLIDRLSPEARNAPESGIVEVFNAGWGRDDLIPLWAGEGDLPTPDFICQAARDSLGRGETFYTYQRGIPQLREALAGYHEDLYGRAFSPERFFVTGSGMQSIQLAVQAVSSAGKEVIVPTPAWPNISAAVEIHGARAVSVPMREEDTGWRLHVEDIEAAITPRTTALFLNSPCNPTGWVASEDLLKDILSLARKHGLWIIADEIYALFYYAEARRAPSFYDVAAEDDQIVFVNSMSKNWAMTGWRIGWISAPAKLGQVFENLIQYSTSGVPSFSQWAAVAALRDGGDFVQQQISRARIGRDTVTDGLKRLNRVRILPPEGAFYLFFKIDGVTDTRQFALDLVRETGVGLAPGTAFGPGGQSYLRLCYARRKDHLEEAVRRIGSWLSSI
ncbi:pyridoxal phosphate-dependent aminotransferase [Roseibium aggregatum]|uniref:Aminotransferase n=1 Tax=Roseibium aggregatum TaxID=187304 RepID=A0A939J2Q9_9HYPH|nr:pyridoxal phosphate-dependent aminotransferase [Roseibium aggregatum]MBN9669360.1 pyridoxal phosphate-dependent aminotransferase [Roseibium aggregatum]